MADTGDDFRFGHRLKWQLGAGRPSAAAVIVFALTSLAGPPAQGSRPSVAYTGPTGNRTVRWFENGDLTTPRATRAGVNSPSIGFFYYGPDAVASFDARFDNVRIRNYAYPEPTIAIGAEAASGARVTLGSQPCTSISVANGTTLTCAIPAHPARGVDVAITNPDGLSFSLPTSFTYREAPWRTYLPVVHRNQPCAR